MKNPLPFLLALFTTLVFAICLSVPAHAQVLGWRLSALDVNRMTVQTIDYFPDEQDCLSARDYIQDNVRPELQGTVILTCGPVRAS